jgi:hypothetical protein
VHLIEIERQKSRFFVLHNTLKYGVTFFCLISNTKVPLVVVDDTPSNDAPSEA